MKKSVCETKNKFEHAVDISTYKDTESCSWQPIDGDLNILSNNEILDYLHVRNVKNIYIIGAVGVEAWALESGHFVERAWKKCGKSVERVWEERGKSVERAGKSVERAWKERG